jgi:hypothetical protein
LEFLMNKTLLIATLLAAVALTACGKKEEAPVVAPAPAAVEVCSLLLLTQPRLTAAPADAAACCPPSQRCYPQPVAGARCVPLALPTQPKPLLTLPLKPPKLLPSLHSNRVHPGLEPGRTKSRP